MSWTAILDYPHPISPFLYSDEKKYFLLVRGGRHEMTWPILCPIALIDRGEALKFDSK